MTTTTPLACGECGETGTYVDDATNYNFTRCTACEHVAHHLDFQLDDGETLEFRRGALHVRTP